MNPIQWCIDQHVNTNHKYDDYLPYEFHLRMASRVAHQFKHLLSDSVDYFTGRREYDAGIEVTETPQSVCLLAVWGHDLIEDTRVSYNDVRSVLGKAAADIIYAVTNEKGRSRKERASEKYYEGIRNTPGATFVKLCDRIANVEYSKMVGSRMYEMYRKENDGFCHSIGYTPYHPLVPMFEHLKGLF